MNLFTVPMKLLTAVVLEEASEEVVRELLRLGVLDFIKVEKLAPEQAAKLLEMSRPEHREAYTDLRVRVETLFRQAGLPLPTNDRLELDSMTDVDVSRATQSIDAISGDLAAIREQQKMLSQTRIRVEEMLAYCKEGKTQYLDVRIGNVRKDDTALLESRLAAQAHMLVSPEGWSDAVLLTLRRDRPQVEPLLEKLQWTENPQGDRSGEALHLVTEELEKRLVQVRQENERVKAAITARVAKDREQLETLWCNLRLHELMGEIESYFSHTRNTTIFSGWVPEESAAELEKSIREASKGVCVIEWIEATRMPREEVPVAVRDVPLLRPFQKLVDNYSVPEYGTVNPTPFVAVAYLVMFGLMFADAGQGLVILLLGVFGVRYFAAHPGKPAKIITADLCRLMIYLGCASVVSGVVFGSYFGFPWFPPLWFDYHGAVLGHDSAGRDVYSILGITIWFGVAVIATGLVINWINLTRKRDWFHLVFDKNGVIGGWLFGWGVWAASFFVKSGYKQFPEGPVLPLVFGIPLVMLLGKVPIHRMLVKRSGSEVEHKSVGALVMDIFLEWLVDVLEIFSGFLANVLSFMRVAGLGIAHVSLMSAFFEMADLVGGGILGFIVMVFGNALVIVLEGLSAGIQSLRLNYYEFFNKFFTGHGLSYNPVALHPHAGRHDKAHTHT